MSVYPKFSSSNTFNSSDIIGSEDGVATVCLDLSSFVQRSSVVFDDSVYLKDGVSLNFNGTVQNSPYDDNEKAINDSNKTKLTNVEYDGTVTKVSSNLDLRESTLLLTDESVAINKVTDLTTTLTGIQDNLDNIQNNDSDIFALQTKDIAHEVRLDDFDTLTGSHSTNLIDIETDILNNVKVDITTNLSSINSNLTDIINNLTLINSNRTRA